MSSLARRRWSRSLVALLPMAAASATPTAMPPVPAAPASASAAAPAAAGQRHDGDFARAGLQVAQWVDAGRLAELWDNASPSARKAVDRQDFIGRVQQARAQAGDLLSRGPAAVSYARFGPGAQVPAGLYANVGFTSRFTRTLQPVRERVSFRLDEDGVWRLSGYALRLSPGN